MTPAANVTDPFDLLLRHDLWGSHQILDAARPLSAEQFTREFPMGPGSLQKTLAHMASAMYRWADVLTGRPPRAPLELASLPTPASFAPAFDEASALLRAQVSAAPLSGTIVREVAGVTYQFTRSVALMQILTHGTYHRAQCVNMLRHLGVAPVPDPSVMKWAMANDAG